MKRLLLEDTRSNGDDSPYLSLADFFSLLSLTLIFIAVAVPSRAPLPRDASPVLVGRNTINNQEVAADPRFAYIYTYGKDEALEADIIGAGGSERRTYSLGLGDEDLEDEALIMLSWIRLRREPTRIILVLPNESGDPRSHQQAIRLLKVIREYYPTSVVLSDE